MESLEKLLLAQGYRKIRFKISRTNHLVIPASINGLKADFILDTGASNSCVGFDDAEAFQLLTQHSNTKAAGAGAIDMLTQESKGNSLKIGRWSMSDFHLVVFDLSHVNSALTQHKVKPVRGIIGADVLMRGKAIIDYENLVLYLK